jgi:PadR family transcriptional regulator, regulatory protein PadR
MAAETLGEFEQVILLAIVHLGSDAYGTTIRREIEQRTGREIAVGALYTALERLERKDFVTSVMSDPTPQRGGRARRHFEIAPAGAVALKRSRDLLASMWNGLTPNLRRTR